MYVCACLHTVCTYRVFAYIGMCVYTIHTFVHILVHISVYIYTCLCAELSTNFTDYIA